MDNIKTKQSLIKVETQHRNKIILFTMKGLINIDL